MNLRAFEGAENSFNVFVSANADQSRVFTRQPFVQARRSRLSRPNPELAL
jgi:hypothetical protein